MRTSLALIFATLAACGTASGQLPLSCGVARWAETRHQGMQPYFISDEPFYEHVRQGRWARLDSTAAPNGVLTAQNTCSALAREANRRINQVFAEDASYRRFPLVHTMHEIGPWYVVVIAVEGASGHALLWVYDRKLKFVEGYFM